MSPGETCHAKIKALRVATGLSLRGAAKVVGVSPAYLSLVEGGNTAPTPDTAQRMLEAYNASAHDRTVLGCFWGMKAFRSADNWHRVMGYPTYNEKSS